jgi:hypothetical protein
MRYRRITAGRRGTRTTVSVTRRSGTVVNARMSHPPGYGAMVAFKMPVGIGSSSTM